MVSSKSSLRGTYEFAFLTSSWDADTAALRLHRLPGYKMETEINICSPQNVVLLMQFIFIEPHPWSLHNVGEKLLWVHLLF